MDVGSARLEGRRYMSIVLSVSVLYWRVSTSDHTVLILLQVELVERSETKQKGADIMFCIVR
jgi:hypothetical protein